MAFNPALARSVSNTFRSACFLRLNTPQRSFFESLLMRWFGLKNIRNAQLWTRPGAVTRDIINSKLGEFELDMRLFVADRFIQNIEPTFPVKRKIWLMPPDNTVAMETFRWFQDAYIREYTTRIFFTDLFFVLEYAADSDTPSDIVDIDSPEFEDLLEDE